LISDPRELYKFLATPGIEVMNFIFASDHVLWISWRIYEDMGMCQVYVMRMTWALSSQRAGECICTDT
jgi:hypothetical protein